ncbi:hypothetical protein C8R47DRAFT_1160911 [Mycena vitilis]|nr:hypothetical protein C8R47DRAFT_1160911 [Mycena vitilis]
MSRWHVQPIPLSASHVRAPIDDPSPHETLMQYDSGVRSDGAHTQSFDDITGQPILPPRQATAPSYNSQSVPPSTLQQTSCNAEEYLRRQLNLPPGVIPTLWCLPEPAGGGKPAIPTRLLVEIVIHSSQKKSLTLQEICNELASRFTWFRENAHDSHWKNSVLHELKKMSKTRAIPGKRRIHKATSRKLDKSDSGYRPSSRDAQDSSDDSSDSDYNAGDPGHLTGTTTPQPCYYKQVARQVSFHPRLGTVDLSINE